MLHTTIVTRDETTGKELPVPADLLEKVRRAARVLEQMLSKVSEKFDIKTRWWFDQGIRNEFEVMLSLSTNGKGTGYPFPKDGLRDDESIRRNLWKPIGYLIPELSEEVDREFQSVRRGLEALATSTEG